MVLSNHPSITASRPSPGGHAASASLKKGRRRRTETLNECGGAVALMRNTATLLLSLLQSLNFILNLIAFTSLPMGLFDKLGGSNPPSYSTTTTANNHHHSNPYQSTTQSTGQTNTFSSPPGGNLDSRPLPPGWEKQWHDGYQRYFYVDTTHPHGPQSHWIHPIDQQSSLNNPPTRSGGYNPPVGQPYYPPAQQTSYIAPQSTYQQPPVQAANSRRPGFNPLLAGAGGLAGGMLLGSMLEGHHYHQDGYMNGYEQGYENGYDNGFDNGDDFGGDFGGGDFF